MKAITKPGHIRLGIDRKVYFEYYELPKPDEKNYSFKVDEGLPSLHYKHDLEEYEASKQLIEVSNKCSIKDYGYHSISGLKTGDYTLKAIQLFTDNQPCKAEITGNICTIIELVS